MSDRQLPARPVVRAEKAASHDPIRTAAMRASLRRPPVTQRETILRLPTIGDQRGRRYRLLRWLPDVSRVTAGIGGE
jgi:hypothetical protein